MGSTGPISLGDYREWPLFQELRKQANFEPIILEVFGEPLKVTLQEPESNLPSELGRSTPRTEGTASAEQDKVAEPRPTAIEGSPATEEE